MKTIWFTKGHASQRAVVSLARAALPVRTLASHTEDREDVLDVADAALLEPRAPDPAARGDAYVDWLIAAARAERVDAVLAMANRTALAARRDDLARAGLRVACGATSVEALETCERKDLFAARLRDVGIPVPETIGIVDEAGLRHALGTLEGLGALCVKPASGVYGRGFWRLDPEADPFAHYADPDARVVRTDLFVAGYAAGATKSRLVVMEFLPGAEHSIDVVADAGRLVAAASRRKHGSFQVVTTRGPEIDLAAAVVSELGLDGLVNVQTKADAAGVAKVLEVNTRYSGGIGYSAAAGVNLPAIAAGMLLGLPVPAGVYGVAEPKAVRIGDAAFALPRTGAGLVEGREVGMVGEAA